ncbi:Ig-like domain-containing protein [Candidatus Binatia bacterium]|nr:Ig-like domain-containing protein [Candidatus Binatia bacterium]
MTPRGLQIRAARRPYPGALVSLCAALVIAAGAATGAHAAPQITLTGPERRGPIAPAPDGSFAFPNVSLKKNSVNTFTVAATDDAGNVHTRDISITQLSLDSVVVSRIVAEPLPPERVIQLVNDGVIDIDDPDNFNVSTFSIVLTIAGEDVPVELPIAFPKAEPTGYEIIKLPQDSGGGKPNPRQITIVVFDEVLPGPPDLPPPRIPGVIIIQGSVKSLKEFFSARLLLMNTSGIFTLSSVKANIEFPDGGLSPTLPLDGTVAFDDILPGDPLAPGQKEREFIFRGDAIGNKRVRVNFGGFVTGPGIPADAPIPFNGSAETAVDVKGPPAFRVRLLHPDSVQDNVPYELTVEIANIGDSPALFASLDLDVGGDAQFVDCVAPTDPQQDPVCTVVPGPLTRNLKHLFPGDVAREVFTINPLMSGNISSCVGVSDQNITLEVLVGNIGCVVGKHPADRSAPEGIPTVHVLPFPNANGIGIDSPVVAFFSERMNTGTITIGTNGTFKVFDPSGAVVPGQLRLAEVNNATVAIWQVTDGITNRLAGNSEYSVVVMQEIRDLQGNALFNQWTSTFTTTSPTNDVTPPTLTLSIEPGVDPTYVIPGQLVRIDAYATDQGTGVARVELRELDTNVQDATFRFVDQKSIFGATPGPTIFVIDSGNLVPGHTYQYKATAFDGAGNLQDATIAIIVAASAAPPTIVLPADPAQDVLHGISIELVPLSLSAGGRNVAYFLDAAAQPFATLTVAPYKTTLGTLGLPLGPHTVRAVATDGLGQTGEDTLQFTLADNPNEPAVAFAGTTHGAQYITGARFNVQGSASDPVGIQSLQFFVDDPQGAPLAGTLGAATIDTASLNLGTHRLFLIATNLLGTSNDPTNPASYVDFAVVDLPNGPPPPAPIVTNVSVPAGNVVRVDGTTVPFARVDLSNATRGFLVTVFANAGGAWTANIDADAGDVLSAVAFDFATSQQPSPPTQAVVPAPPVLDRIEVTPNAVTLVTPNATQDLTVTAFYVGGTTANVTGQSTFSSNNGGVASVTSTGRVRALANGQATIAATALGMQATALVTVAVVTLDSISVSPSPVDLTFLNETVTLTVTRHFSDGNTQVGNTGAAFAMADAAVATVNSSGLVTAKANGATSLFVSVPGLPPIVVPVTVVAADPDPTVQFLSPAAGTQVERGDLVTVNVQANDVGSGVVRVELDVSGATTFSDSRQVAATAATTQSFSFSVSNAAPVGGTVTLTVRAIDGSGNVSVDATRTLTVVDQTAPAVTITAPAPGTLVNFGDTVTLSVSATDAVAVDRIRFETTGSFTTSGSQTIAPASTPAGADFAINIPYGLTAPDLIVRAYARDAAGNEAVSVPVGIVISDADITPPATVVTAVAPPGAGTTTTVTYDVADGLADLNHVELYFRRNGIGTFNRYTGPTGTADGEYFPQSGNMGTIAFDSTRMGGDGAYEFVTVGVDQAGNREPFPRDGSNEIIGDSGATATFATGAPVTVINSATDIFDASLDDQNLRIDGATVTVDGTRTFRNVELLNGAVLTHRLTDTTTEYRLDVSAWTLTVDATSRVDVTGRGYVGGRNYDEAGRTAGNQPGSGRRNGGSYGGLGGHDPAVSEQPGPVYGDLTEPLDLGSGGGAEGHADGGDGGGLALAGVINVVVDGTVRADGGTAPDSRSGMGSGGGINVRTRTLSGRGTIEADGGTKNGANNVGGGGGRIAVRYLDAATYDPARITARGGDGFYADGADGTVFLKQESEPNGELVINGTTPGAPFTNLILPPGQTFDGLTLQNNARVVALGMIDLTGTLRLRGNSVLTHPSEDVAGLQINAARVEVEAGSAIDVTGRGYRGGRAYDEPGMTLGNIAGSGRRNGGSHGGLGAHDGAIGEQPGAVYGDPRQPDRLGGGGGADGHTDGGDGGGYVRIVATDAVVVDGAVRADGATTTDSRAGMGAGGSVWIATSRLAGAGTISANGGNKNGANNIGGGGGRVALYADFVDALSDLNALRNVTAWRGRGFYDSPAGSAGTVYVALAGQVDGDLIVDDNESSQTAPNSTPLHLIGPGTAAAVTADTLTVDGTIAPFLPNALVGLRLNPDRTQAETFRILSNTATDITVATPNEHGVAFAAVAGVGLEYAGHWQFDNLRFRRGGNLVVGDALVVNDTLELAEFALLTHPETDTQYEAELSVTADAVTIDAGSRIEVTGRGYIGGQNYDEAGRTLGNAYGSGRRNGGSHGGLGGHDTGISELPGATYGSLTDPRDLGSGGGAEGHSDGGDGGGRVLLVANTLANDGVLRANGAQAPDSRSGMGSGGTINLRVGQLTGSGQIRADGGTKNGANNVGGGGGRVAIGYTSLFTLPLANVSALGGDGFYADGQDGTIHTQQVP